MDPIGWHTTSPIYVYVCVFCPLQVKTEITVESMHQTMQGLSFPLQEEAKKALHQLAQKCINYIQLVRGKHSYVILHSDSGKHTLLIIQLAPVKYKKKKR